MNNFQKTVILRHKRENLKKCSLRGLEKREDFLFLTYPQSTLPDIKSTVLLTLDAPCLSNEDANYDLLLIDATWTLAAKMESTLGLQHHPRRRSLPAHFQTAYPRKQTACADPLRGLASIEALYVAYHLLGKEGSFLLENYHWKESFLSKNDWH